MKVWNKIGQAVDSMNEVGGRIGWFLIIFLMSFGLYDVIMRYLFNSPSQWIWMTLKMGVVMLAALAGGYALQKGAFIKLDLIYARFSTRGKAIADIFTFVFILLSCVILIWKGIEAAQGSIAIRQMTHSVPRLPIYWLKALIPLGAFLVLLVAVKKFIFDIKTVLHRGAG